MIGGGHAGTEAALAAARAGARTLLLTHNIETVGAMSCNPAIGGIGKGHLVKEIDALGGAMARAADAAGIQWRTLNASKGPAVRATRCQADRALYRAAIRRIGRDAAEPDRVPGGGRRPDHRGRRACAARSPRPACASKRAAVVLTAGTFLAGKIHVGQTQYAAGRAGDPPATTLAARLRERPFVVDRLKTGTPPRIDGRTLDYTRDGRTARRRSAPGDVLPRLARRRIRARCRAGSPTPASARTRSSAARCDRSPLYTGQIEGIGPRYCPSIEDKVVRFAEKASHQIFVEPEGLDIAEIYPNGISTSLPFDVQLALVRIDPRLRARAHHPRPATRSNTTSSIRAG